MPKDPSEDSRPEIRALIDRIGLENAAAFDILGLLAMAFARASPKEATALRLYLSALQEHHQGEFSNEFNILCRRMDWALAGKDMELLSRTTAATNADAATDNLLRVLQARAKRDKTPPPDKPL